MIPGFLKIYKQSIAQLLVIRDEQREISKLKMEEARKLYWDACKLPRKKKKEVRKKARADFEFHHMLSNYFF